MHILVSDDAAVDRHSMSLPLGRISLALAVIMQRICMGFLPLKIRSHPDTGQISAPSALCRRRWALRSATVGSSGIFRLSRGTAAFLEAVGDVYATTTLGGPCFMAVGDFLWLVDLGMGDGSEALLGGKAVALVLLSSFFVACRANVFSYRVTGRHKVVHRSGAALLWAVTATILTRALVGDGTCTFVSFAVKRANSLSLCIKSRFSMCLTSFLWRNALPSRAMEISAAGGPAGTSISAATSIRHPVRCYDIAVYNP